jgi:hypothetical protein
MENEASDRYERFQRWLPKDTPFVGSSNQDRLEFSRDKNTALCLGFDRCGATPVGTFIGMTF